MCVRQTQMPEGYTLSGEQTVTVVGGEVQRVRVPLEEYALLSVSKTGLTFNDKLANLRRAADRRANTVYTMENGSLSPYPSASEQTTVWANAAPSEKGRQRQAPGRAGGHDVLSARDERRGRVRGGRDDLRSHADRGRTRVLDCAVSSDRGFFELDLTDISTGAHVSGGRF